MAPDPTVVRCSTAADLLRLEPLLVDVPAHDSLVLVLFRGTRTHRAMRLDLLRSRTPHIMRGWAAQALGRACRVEGVDGIVPVVHTDDAFAPTGRLPRADLLRILGRQARAMGLEVRDLLCVAADGWGSLLDPELPRGGRPLAEIAPRDGDPQPSPRTVPEYGERSRAARSAFARALERWWVHPEGPGGVLHGVDLRRRGTAFGRAAALRPAMQRYRHGEDTADLVRLVERVLDPHDDAADRPCPCRALLFALATRQGLETLVLVQFGWGQQLAQEVWQAVNSGDGTAAGLDVLQAAIGGLAFRRPDVDRVERAIEVLVAVGEHVPAADRAPVDGMLAWLHWAIGSGSIAGALANRAQRADPGRDVPSFVLSRVGGGVLPEWAYAEDPAALDPLRELREPGQTPPAA